jgi:hypothetical protein
MKLLPSVAFIGAATALDCGELETHTMVELGGDNVSVNLRCTYDLDDMNHDVQVEIYAEDPEQNHQKIMKQAGADKDLLPYNIEL